MHFDSVNGKIPLEWTSGHFLQSLFVLWNKVAFQYMTN